MVSLLFIIMFCVWSWTHDDVLSVLQRFEEPGIEDQCEIYMKHNKKRSVSKGFKIHTNGDINVHLCARIPFVLKRAAFVASEYESKNPRTTHAATLILVVFWEVFSDMRYVFYVLWKSKFTKNADNDRPFEIFEMLRRGFRAMYIAYNLCSVMVCQCV